MSDFFSIKNKKKFFDEISKGFINDNRDDENETYCINVEAVKRAVRKLYGME